MLERDCALAGLEKVHCANSASALFDIFDNIGPDFGVGGFVLVRAQETVAPGSARSMAVIEGGRLRVDGGRFSASCPLSHRVAMKDEIAGWVRMSRQRRDTAGSLSLFCEPANDDRVEFGRIVPTRTPQGRRGTVSLLPMAADEDGDHALWHVMLALALHGRLDWLEARKGSGNRSLSPREHEILAWMAEGKSAEDVAEILKISAATVMFHYRNVATRYGTLNRTHTVVEAFRRGELPLDVQPQPLQVMTYEDFVI